MMQLVENTTLIDGKRLTLDTPLEQILTCKEMDLELREPYLSLKPSPEDIAKLKANASKITVRDLLNHRSGLTGTNEEGPERFFEQLPEDIKRPYSNYGFQLLARTTNILFYLK